MPLDYKSWYESARAELAKVREEKAELARALADRDKQIAALIQTMNAIAPLVGEQPIEEPAADDTAGGMTDSIRSILAHAGEPLSAAEIRDRLGALGFDMASYSNPLATIHTILRRLVESYGVEIAHDLNVAAPGPKKFTMPTGRVEKIVGKDFEIGKMKGFIGVGRLRRARRVEHREGR